jgi:lipoyl(octanoyl) transferase
VSELLIVDLGTRSYASALELQRDVARRRITGEIAEDVLMLVEHPPVVTLGRTAKGNNLIASREYLASQGVELFEVERGGDITFHGPGQLVGYPVMDLKRHRKDLIQSIEAFGIAGGRVDKYTGVWVEADRNSRRKIASIGVHARDWVTWHGFALNVNTDLRYFDLIVPCGISGVTMTSVTREAQRGSMDMQAVAREVVRAFGNVFSLTPRSLEPTHLEGSAFEPGDTPATAHPRAT